MNRNELTHRSESQADPWSRSQHLAMAFWLPHSFVARQELGGQERANDQTCSLQAFYNGHQSVHENETLMTWASSLDATLSNVVLEIKFIAHTPWWCIHTMDRLWVIPTPSTMWVIAWLSFGGRSIHAWK